MDMYTVDFEAPRAADELFAELTDFCREYRDCAEPYTESNEFEAYDQMDELLERLSGKGILGRSLSRRCAKKRRVRKRSQS